MPFEGRVCIVTGASSGIGEAIALLFAERKASLLLCGRSEYRLNKVASKCQELSGKANKIMTVLGDLKISEVRKRICETAISSYGRIDLLIANAGILGNPVSMETATDEMYNLVMETNVKSVFFLIQEALPWLEQSKGNVVCMSSMASAINGDALIYHMAKAAVDHMVRCLATSLGPKGIRINSVNPTFVQTRLLRTVMPDMETLETIQPDPFTQSKRPHHPLEGRCASAEEVAKAVAFLGSDEASFVTGQNLFVDGGISRTCIAFQTN